MSLVDIAGDTGGFLSAISAALAHLDETLASASLLLEVLIVATCVLIAVEVARGVLRR